MKRIQTFKTQILMLAGLCTVFFVPSTAHAIKFANQFIEFDLPFKWNCSLEGAEWVCQSTDNQKKRDAIIVLAAKLKGDQDTLDKYQDYLSKSRVFTAPGGKGVTSQPKYAKVIQLNGKAWVDSIHLESEIPGFYTRYLATVEKDIGVLVTYSINKVKYQDYLGQFEDMVKSLKVFRKAGGVNTNANSSIFSQAQLPGSFTGSQVFPDQPAVTATPAPKKPKQDDDLMLYLVIIAGVIGFIIYKKRRSRGL